MSDVQQLDFGSVPSVAPDTSRETVSKEYKKRVKAKKSAKKKKEKKQLKKEERGKYKRGEQNSTKNVRSFALRKVLKSSEALAKKATETASRAEILLPSEAGYLEAEGMEQTWRFTQEGLKEHVDVRTANKMFELKLDQFGPYVMDYTRNGRHMILSGRKGHVASFEWQGFQLGHELHLRETVRDIKFLHNETMYATAQKKYVYIYDNTGMELHCLRNRVDVNVLDFLPYHFLLVAAGKSGMLQYTDTSTGANVAEHKTRLGEVKCMTHNPRNAISLLGNNNGTVTMWSPNMSTPLVKMLCHHAPVLAVAVDAEGHNVVTSGLDGQVKVWDIRTYKEIHSYFTVRPATTIDVSDMGMLALGYGSHVSVWKDALRTKAKSPYMRQEFSGKSVGRVRFCPYEDVLGVTHSDGFSSLVIPGAGEPNFDTYAANPFESSKQRREKTVVSLLDKLQPDMITMDNTVFGLMDKKSKALFDGGRKAIRDAKAGEQLEDSNKKRGKSRSSNRFKRKRKNIVDVATEARKLKIAKIHKQRTDDKKEKIRKATGVPKSALDRFNVIKVRE